MPMVGGENFFKYPLVTETQKMVKYFCLGEIGIMNCGGCTTAAC